MRFTGLHGNGVTAYRDESRSFARFWTAGDEEDDEEDEDKEPDELESESYA